MDDKDNEQAGCGFEHVDCCLYMALMLFLLLLLLLSESDSELSEVDELFEEELPDDELPEDELSEDDESDSEEPFLFFFLFLLCFVEVCFLCFVEVCFLCFAEYPLPHGFCPSYE